MSLLGMRWIFSSFAQDLGWLYIIPLVLILLAHTVSPGLWDSDFGWSVVVFANVVDLGHSFTTGWRTYLRPEELRRSKMYWLAPALIFPATCLLVKYQYDIFRYLSGYLIMIHAIRQYYGQMRWYERLNGVKRQASGYFLYALCIWPMLIYHFAQPKNFTPTGPEFFHWPVDEVRIALKIGYGFIIAAWLVYEIRLSRQGSSEWNRRLAIAAPAIFYFSANFIGETPWQSAFPLAIGHGLAYIGLTGLAIERLDRRPRHQAMLRSAGTGLIIGGVLFALSPDPLISPWFFGLFMAPVFCHYLFDAFIWTGRHAEAHIVYAVPGKPGQSDPKSSENRVA